MTALAMLPLLLGASSSFESFTLSNGLQVVLDPEPHRNSVAVVAAYPVGRSGGPPGRRGLSHLVEHLVFRRAGRVGRFQAVEHLQDVGGQFNGTTHPGYTLYECLIPPSELETMLFYERERMGFSRDAVTADDLRLEQAIVARELELRGGVGRDLYRARLQAFLPPSSPWIPSKLEKEEVQEHTLEDVRWFLERYHRPDNAILAISGRFDAERTRRFIQEIFGALVAPEQPLPARVGADPRLAGPKASLEVHDPGKEAGLGRVWMFPHRSGRVYRHLARDLLHAHLSRALKPHTERIHDRTTRWEVLGSFEVLSHEVEGKASRSLDPVAADYARAIAELPESIDAMFEGDRLDRAKTRLQVRYLRYLDTPMERAKLAATGWLEEDTMSFEQVLEQIETATVTDVRPMLEHALSTQPLPVRTFAERDDFDFELKGVER